MLSFCGVTTNDHTPTILFSGGHVNDNKTKTKKKFKMKKRQELTEYDITELRTHRRF